MRRHTGIILILALLMLLFALPAFAEDQARDLTPEASIKVGSKGFAMERLRDRDYTSRWVGDSGGKTVEIKSDSPIHSLYVCFYEDARAWLLEEYIAGKWHKREIESSPFKHQFLELSGAKHIRLKPSGKSQKWFGLTEIFIFGEGRVPGFVQRWQEPKAQNDLMLLFAHPDDEALFFGGTIPVYAGERQLDVVALTLTTSSPTRHTELLNSLWTMGLKTYPVFGPIGDKHSNKLSTAYKDAGESKVKRYAVEIMRKYQPQVVITHDVDGEYGHGQHKLCADVALYAFDAAGDASKFADSAAQYGVFLPSKLYLHLYKENPIVMDWDQPLSAFLGKTGFEMAKEGFLCHQTQQRLAQFQVEGRDSPNSSYHFGLARTRVGLDILGKDFMENLESAAFVVDEP